MIAALRLGVLAWPFWNAEERRLRALWRLALHGLGVSIVWTLIGWTGALAAGAIGGAAVLYGLNVLGVIAVTWLAARVLDRRPFPDLGLRARRGYLADVALGTAIGGFCMATIAIVEDVLGLATYAPRVGSIEALAQALPAIGSSFTVFVGVAIVEELVSRGYHLTNLAEGLARPGAPRHPLATMAALAISSGVFGLGHAQNPSATPVSVAFIAVGGVFLAIGYLTQGDLAVPIGAHLGWNFFQNLLGMPVSGMTDFHQGALVTRTEIGDDLWSGGAFGPEAGLTGLVGMGLGIALTVAWVRARTGRVRVVARFGTPPRRTTGVPDSALGA